MNDRTLLSAVVIMCGAVGTYRSQYLQGGPWQSGLYKVSRRRRKACRSRPTKAFYVFLSRLALSSEWQSGSTSACPELECHEVDINISMPSS